MNKQEVYEFMSKNPAFFLATADGDQPKVRGMLLYKADESGIVFHSGTMKEVYRQIQKNPKAELCFNDFKKGLQVRVRGQLEIVDDHKVKDEIVNHPTRKFLTAWVESMKPEDFYKSFVVFKLVHGVAVVWTMATNFEPNVDIEL
ncbi:pyridoxamine 5'-phosphate oxidase family protein [Acetobacterium tundrae]|uniref:Pyridoxamine 5'-phosphate oxidase family protein n=1 Tax=Acetobacterium tundrae TaxID=132932 RepID=A0ABR6WJ29_9FIRM|nr:pyridoxamine 5'-phosphate oxidase family protein [Acetobacterium tundrae]MBC3796494.1 pyridoxamine 5'-phosphate oxidase family protein [Acetobacterium tundrae]